VVNAVSPASRSSPLQPTDLIDEFGMVEKFDFATID
jgi:hypothetical protein